jgi:hypothetical protein
MTDRPPFLIVMQDFAEEELAPQEHLPPTFGMGGERGGQELEIRFIRSRRM